MSQIVIYFLHSTLVLSFYIDVVLTPSIWMCLVGKILLSNSKQPCQISVYVIPSQLTLALLFILLSLS